MPGSVDLETGVGAYRFGVANEQKSNVHRYQPHLYGHLDSLDSLKCPARNHADSLWTVAMCESTLYIQQQCGIPGGTSRIPPFLRCYVY